MLRRYCGVKSSAAHKVVADACVLFEDYLERELAEGRASLTLKAGPSTVVLHGHCHQKAMGLVPTARALPVENSFVQGRRPRLRMRRHGGFLRLFEGPLRGLAPESANAVCFRPRAP
jgi:hypothetical protein